MGRNLWVGRLIIIFWMASFFCSACLGSRVGEYTIPSIEKGKFNFVLVLPTRHDDQGWSQAQYEGLLEIQKIHPEVYTAYVEGVTADAKAGKVFSALGKAGFDLVIAGSNDYVDAVQNVAPGYPNTVFLDVGGYKTNLTNFGVLTGAQETLEYLAGVVAGGRARKDGVPKLGFIASFRNPQEYRLVNAFTLGARRSCPECSVDVRFISSWSDSAAQKNAAEALYTEGAQVVTTDLYTSGVLEAAEEHGKWAIANNWVGSCSTARCLTAPYWIWSPIYERLVNSVRNHTYKPGYDYFDADSKALGLYGFMDGQTLQPGTADLPEGIRFSVKQDLNRALSGEMNRFQVFSGPLKDNEQKMIVPAGNVMTQFDLEQFPEMKQGCTYCMRWWSEGITSKNP